MSPAPSTQAPSPRRSQAWFPGVYVPVSHIHGAEIFESSRGGVRVVRTTIHGTAAELRGLAVQLMRAADRVDNRAAPAERAA